MSNARSMSSFPAQVHVYPPLYHSPFAAEGKLCISLSYEGNLHHMQRNPTEAIGSTLSRLQKTMLKDRKKRNKKGSLPEGGELEVEIVSRDGGISIDSDIPCSEALVNENAIILGKTPLEIVYPAPRILNVDFSSPDSYPKVGCEIFPKVATHYTDTLFIEWRARLNGEDTWKRVGTGATFIPQASLADAELRVFFHAAATSDCNVELSEDASLDDRIELREINNTTQVKRGFSHFVTFRQPVKATPVPKLLALREDFCRQIKPKNGFRVVTYNILADCYTSQTSTKEQLFPYAEERKVLDASYRLPLVLQVCTSSIIVFLNRLL